MPINIAYICDGCYKEIENDEPRMKMNIYWSNPSGTLINLPSSKDFIFCQQCGHLAYSSF